MRLADYFARRKKKIKKCDVCGQKYDSIEEMENHRRNSHPELQPASDGDQS
jgi:ribosomal protein L34E